MAMNKAEQAAFEALNTEMAFRWPTEAEPARVVVATASGEKLHGWDFNVYSLAVERRWTSTISNGSFFQGDPMGGSQGKRDLYATERDALLALRWGMCRKTAAELRAVDKRIALATPGAQS